MFNRFLFIIFLVYGYSYSYDFSKIDSIVNSGISHKYYPCAQLLIGNEYGVLYEKTYGNFTYDENSTKLNEYHLFDLASVTKVIATTSAIMKLYENGDLNLDDKVTKYIPEFDNNGKGNITIRNLLLHNSGLKAWIPFYKYYKTKEEVLSAIYNITLEYSPETKFVYSDLNAILLGLIVEKISGQNLSDFCIDNIFYKLGMKNTLFNPNDDYKKNCAPTEYDTYWRNKQLQGEVHDEAAYILGGISGNAGLFSNIRDLHIFMEMMLNSGKYYNPFTRGLKEERLFKESTVELFTKKVDGFSYYNTRALGWDTKPEPNKYRTQCGELFSDNCFGHTGYTGTSVWCDKDRKVYVIFLTNRVFPSRGNEGIKLIRPDLHNEILTLITNNK
jgi:CubicO group peptidase (beta-lactamase class C family)